ncbi:hypothetical protein [Enterococcus avium]|uniref:hypothetical protein n=1 Tax=Enterococcus avium TaxID=33945 RepID=UPI000F51532C|nr:hypothetical protein [Enterococcus avium]MDT2432208.1 hypothetical protein [Enterococcus avium]MDT2449882.1 hypothetical protein [Enterococcus avium]MDT2493828.1 hypothetical protein [Enterococcus avium]ROZ48229.1 hypothetical protein EGX28_02525 [Enterococcus avium]
MSEIRLKKIVDEKEFDMQYEIGDTYEGKDCNNVEIKGKIVKILEKTMIVENGINRYLVKKNSKKR